MALPKNVDRFKEFAGANPRIDVRVVPGAEHGLRDQEGKLVSGIPADIADWILALEGD